MGELEKKSQEKYGDDITNKVIQAASDARKIVQAVSQIKEIQSRAEKIHKEEYMENNEVEEDFDEVWEKEYNKSDKFNEYLVNGALLTCTQATVEPFIIPGDAPIELHRDPDETEFDFKYGFGRKQTCLNVEENGLYLGKLPYATVKDTVRDVNIIPFRCNCAQEITGFSEIEYIRDHLEDCKENGVCKYLMWLNEEWDNMALSNTENTAIPPSYLSISDVEWVRAEDGTLQKNVCNSEGITRTSVLLCRRGGLIVPLTSGQKIITKSSSIDILHEYLSTGEFDEDEVEEALAYLAGLSKYKLQEYTSNLGLDYNRYDVYILGWTEYYNIVFDMEIDPNYIKSQCYEESRIGHPLEGEAPAYNSERDIMQALDVRNDNIYEYIDISIDNFQIYTSQKKYISGREILKKNHKDSRGPSNDDKKDRCGGIINTLFNTEENGSGTCYYEGSKEIYFYQLETVTPIMSIGLGLDRMQELLKKYAGNYYEALKEYNGSDTKEDYANEIMKRAETKADSLSME